LWIYSWVRKKRNLKRKKILKFDLRRLFTTFAETKWGNTSTFPTPEMKARGDVKRLWVGVLIALPSGAGVALSVLGGNTGKHLSNYSIEKKNIIFFC
jgi:hypothetical protein